MPRHSLPGTRKLWADRLERFEQANQTVAQFCAAENVSVASFYQWRRKLNPIEQTTQTHSPKFLPVQIPAAGSDQPATILSLELPGGISVKLQVHNQANSSS